MALGQGATMSLPTWALFMKKCYDDPDLEISQEKFEVPDGITVQLECDEEADTSSTESQELEDENEF